MSGSIDTKLGTFHSSTRDIPCIIVKGYDINNVETSSLSSLVSADLMILGQGSNTYRERVPKGISEGSFEYALDYTVPVDIKLLDAKADGITDDTSAFTSAISDSSIETLLVSAGTYLVSQITVNRQIRIIIEHGATIKLKDAQNSNVFYITADNVVIQGSGTIDGNKANQSSGSTAGIYVDAVDFVIVDGITVTSCYFDAIDFRNASAYWKVLNCYLVDNGTMGIRSHTGTHGLIQGCFAKNNGHSGIDLDAYTSDTSVVGNNVTGNTNGIFVEEGTKYCSISNNVCWSNTNGINVNQQVSGTLGRVSIHGNICRQNNNEGIRVSANGDNTRVESISIIGNVCSDNGRSSGSGIRLAASTGGTNRVMSDVIVVGNVLNDQETVPTQLYGINASGANMTTVTQNNNITSPNSTADLNNIV